MSLISEKHAKPRSFSSCGYENNDEKWNFVLLAVAIVFVCIICAIYTVAAASTGISPAL